MRVLFVRSPSRVDLAFLQRIEAEGTLRVEVESDPGVVHERLSSSDFVAAVVDQAIEPRGGLSLIRQLSSASLRVPLFLQIRRVDPLLEREAEEAGCAGLLVEGDLTAREFALAVRHASAAFEVGSVRRADFLERLTRCVSHEGKNALAGIRAGVHVIWARLETGGTELEIFAEIQQRLRGLDAALEDLNLLFRPIRPLQAPSDLSALLREVAATARPNAPPQIRVSQVQLTCDVTLLRRALKAILEFACDAVSETNVVRVTLRKSGAWCHVEIRAEGPALAEAAARALDGLASTQKTRALGFGLSLARRIAHAHGGRLEIVSQDGPRTGVDLALPLDDAA